MALSQREQDIQRMLAAQVHLGTKQCDFQMERYVYRRRQDGIFVINLGKTWEKLQLAARVIVAIENPQDVVVQSARPYAQRAVLKFAQYTGAKALAGRYTPGATYSGTDELACTAVPVQQMSMCGGPLLGMLLHDHSCRQCLLGLIWSDVFLKPSRNIINIMYKCAVLYDLQCSAIMYSCAITCSAYPGTIRQSLLSCANAGSGTLANHARRTLRTNDCWVGLDWLCWGLGGPPALLSG